MKILRTKHDLKEAIYKIKNLGFVPTMGSIHNGHISLIKKSKKICKKTIVSIFINPTQFNNKKDFKTYPRNIKKDLLIIKKIKGVDFVYIPKFKDIYNYKRKSKIKLSKKDKILCAKFRKGHFEGVLDVMDRLTNLIRPNKIFMGNKDFQQLFLVKNFIEKKYKTKIIPCKTIRDKDKLALSSRNNLFNKNELDVARKLAKKLFILKKAIKNKKNINKFLTNKKNKLQKDFKINIEYLENRYEKSLLTSNKSIKSKIFISYYIGDVRLIDNF